MSNDSPSRRAVAAAIASFFFTAALILLALQQMQPPFAVSAAAPPEDFSSGRAMEHLKMVAQAPHPTGSPKDAEVREYIVRNMRALGLECQVQTTTVVQTGFRRRGPAVGATVNNVVCRLAGSADTKAVMLVTHHDSVPTGPGASDDGAGIVTLLETARALRAAPQLRNDVIFLFTDAEELGLLGAKAFVGEHPWAKNIGLVVNFEARGTCGPSLMFESSQGNGMLIQEFAKAAPHPVASSFLYDFYKRLPNDTDLTVFKQAGLAGLNFSYADCWPRYHTMGDSIENIDERSLQHHGSYGLALARHFGNINLPVPPANDSVYFNILGSMVHYPASWVMPHLIIMILLFATVLSLGLRKGRLHWRGLMLGAWGWLAGALLSAVISQLLWNLLSRTSLASMIPYGMAYNSKLFAAAFLALTIAIVSAVYVILLKRLEPENLVMGTLCWWLLLAAATGLYAPGGSYLFAWPLLFGLVSLGCVIVLDVAGVARLALAWALPTLAAALLFAPVPYMLLAFLSTTGLPVMTVAAALLVGFLAPQILAMAAPARWLFSGAAAALALFLLVLGAARSGYDASHPRATSLFYFLNDDDREAFFVSGDSKPNEWSSQFLTGTIEKRSLSQFTPFDAPALVSRAPLAQLGAPIISVDDDVTAGEIRILRVRVRPARPARAVWISARNCRILGSIVNGRELPTQTADSGERRWDLYYVGIPEEGVVLSLVIRKGERLALRIVDQSDGLPNLAGASFPPRPAHLMPSPMLAFDSATMVSKTFDIPERLGR